VYLCALFWPQNKSTSALYNINGLAFVTEMESVYCSVRTESSLNKTLRVLFQVLKRVLQSVSTLYLAALPKWRCYGICVKSSCGFIREPFKGKHEQFKYVIIIRNPERNWLPYMRWYFSYENKCCYFCRVPKHGKCHGMSRQMQAVYAIKLPCSGTR
jgi:hypothetical protein